jgi:hypothetical protein
MDPIHSIFDMRTLRGWDRGYMPLQDEYSRNFAIRDMPTVMLYLDVTNRVYKEIWRQMSWTSKGGSK